MARMTIDALAQAAGITTRNVRAYQDRGLLPPPQKLGRTGYYGEIHLARLRVIHRLLARGFSLQSIGDLFLTWEEGRSLSDVLGFEEAMVGGDAEAEVAVHVSEDDLAEWYGGLDYTLLNKAADMGLLRRTQDGFDVPNMQLIEIGRALVAAGYDLDALLRETQLLQREAKVIATRWLDLWEHNVWEPYVRAGSPPGRLGEIAAAMDRLREIPALTASTMIGLAMREQSKAKMAKIIESSHERAKAKAPPAKRPTRKAGAASASRPTAKAPGSKAAARKAAGPKAGAKAVGPKASDQKPAARGTAKKARTRVATKSSSR